MVMKKVKFSPTATVVFQMTAHSEVDCIVDEQGKVYVHYPTPDVAHASVIKSAAPEPAANDAGTTTEKIEERPAKIYTEKELQKIAAKDDGQKKLLSILEDELGIDADSVIEGRKTSGRLVDAILDAQEKSAPAPKKDADEESPRGRGAAAAEDGDAVIKTAKDLLTQIEDGTIKTAAATSAFMEAHPKANETKVRELFKQFYDNSELKVSEHVKNFASVVGGSAAATDDEAPRGRGAKEKTVSIEHLAENCEVGQRLKAYWPQYDEWYAGEIESIKRGKVNVLWDDQTEAILNVEEHPKIVLL